MSTAGEKQKMNDTSRQLDQLDDDCLLKIFSFLKMQDLLTMEAASKRFQEPVSQAFLQFRILDFNEEKCRSYSFGTAISSRVGPNLHTVRADGSDKELVFETEMLRNVLENCPNIQHFELRNLWTMDMLPSFKKYLTYRQHHIKTISLPRMVNIDLVKFSQDQILAEIFQHTKELETVNVEGWQITGSCLRFLNTLKRATLSNTILAANFKTFCENNDATLECLEFKGDPIIDGACYDIITSVLKNLRELSIVCPIPIFLLLDPFQFPFTTLASSPKLTSLTVENCNSFVLALLKNLAEKNQLVELKLSLDPGLSDDEKQEILRHSFQIRGLKSYHFIRNSSEMEKAFNDDCLQQSLMDQLEKLRIPGTAVTENGIQQFIVKHPTLKSVDLTDCPFITDVFPKQITNCVILR